MILSINEQGASIESCNQQMRSRVPHRSQSTLREFDWNVSPPFVHDGHSVELLRGPGHHLLWLLHVGLISQAYFQNAGLFNWIRGIIYCTRLCGGQRRTRESNISANSRADVSG
jgi:hypothetical protein